MDSIERQVSHYYVSSDNGGSQCVSEVNSGCELWFIPWQHHSDVSDPYIEHRKNGEVVRIVNWRFVEDVIFKPAAKPQGE